MRERERERRKDVVLIVKRHGRSNGPKRFICHDSWPFTWPAALRPRYQTRPSGTFHINALRKMQGFIGVFREREREREEERRGTECKKDMADLTAASASFVMIHGRSRGVHVAVLVT